ncbi:hypothetical protein O6H91_01G061600 [Diphasiastrum complanatum]|uniref:Uncharacterized protein n=2 Tax=Diphasiastrum complanatum TaxID=34168 RepID=A0ACC2ERQ2_DIPCM|nr:hypothetical protein O6H91_01G061600 [Diphasiastrum complanatum]KAJ7569121.1 hypothetical protein O6H91_01G061600 [Diphasiastrum complanatum]
MGERKVLNKYYPPDFDPSKIPRRRQPKNQQIKVRTMLPMSIRCNTCGGNYIYKGTKFNSRKEDVVGETYLGIQIFRFYFKCSRCSAELTMKTDPQNSDYVMEAGATRNFELWRAADEAVDGAKKKRESEELGDAMKALENRTLDSKQEMDILAALDEMKSMRARHSKVETEDMLRALQKTTEVKEELAEEDEAIIRSVVFRNSKNFVRRLDDDLEDNDELEMTIDRSRSKLVKRRKTHEVGVDTNEKCDELLEVKNVSREIDPPTGKHLRGDGDTTPAFVMRPLAVAFSIKPKALACSLSGQEHDLKSHRLPTGIAETETLTSHVTGKDESANLGLSLLCATYDSDSS